LFSLVGGKAQPFDTSGGKAAILSQLLPPWATLLRPFGAPEGLSRNIDNFLSMLWR
jgi:hypothetical protein